MYFDRGLFTAWSLASLDFLIIAVMMLVRFRAGRWRSMRVIETAPRLTEASSAVTS